MGRLKRSEEAVSPVIAIILMVAITVVLSAALYVMVMNVGDDATYLLVGNIRHRGDTEFEFESLEAPKSSVLSDMTITVLNVTGEEETRYGNDETVSWSVLDGGEAASGSRFDVEGFDNIDGYEDISEVVVRVRGYSNMITYER